MQNRHMALSPGKFDAAITNNTMISNSNTLHNPTAEKNRLELHLSLIAVLLGLALRSWQYLADTSLSIDEIALARNIQDLSWSALLFSPLDYAQTAPTGFLTLVKLAVTVLGPSDMVFRLVPYLCSLVGMLVFFRLTARLPGYSGLAALILFALSPGLIKTSLLVKPYGSDILVTLWLIWLTMNLLDKAAKESPRPKQEDTGRSLNAAPSAAGYVGLLRKDKNVWPALAVAGLVSVWFSYPAVFTLGAIGLTLLAFFFLGQIRQLSPRPLILILSSWLISALAALFFAKSNLEPQTLAYFKAHWALGFAPLNDGMLASLLWLVKRMEGIYAMVVNGGTGGPIPVFYLLAGAAGALIAWKRIPHLALLLYLQILLALAAAAAGFYPLLERVTLFLLPSFVILAALSLDFLSRLLPKRTIWLPVLASVIFIIPAVYSYAKNPVVYKSEEMEPLLAYVQEHREVGDKFYIYYGAAQAVMFYGHRFGLEPACYLVGGCHRGSIRNYLKELECYRGQSRVWILFSHLIPRFKEKPAILSYLSTIGTQKQAISFPGCSAHLFDLSDETRLRAASAASHEFEPCADTGLAWGCGRGPHASHQPKQK